MPEISLPPADGENVDHQPAADGPTPCGCASADPPAAVAGWRARVASMPAAPVAVALVLILALGYLIGGIVGGVLLTVGLLGYVVVVAAGWPALSRVERLLRLTVLVFLLGLALVRVFPR